MRSDEQEDKAFFRTFGGVMVLLTVGAIVLLALAVFASTFEPSRDQARAEFERKRVEERIRPVAAVVAAGDDAPEVAAAANGADDDEGDEEDASADEDVAMGGAEVYEAACMACHDAGVMNAPVIGDEGAWASLHDEKGLETLVYNAINGIGSMPARGGDSSLSDQEILNSVVYILEESGVAIDESEQDGVELDD